MRWCHSVSRDGTEGTPRLTFDELTNFSNPISPPHVVLFLLQQSQLGVLFERGAAADILLLSDILLSASQANISRSYLYVSGANSQSCGERGLKKTPTMVPPSAKEIECSIHGGGRSGALRWRGADERAMNAIGVVIVPELCELPGQVHSIPEEYPVEVLTPDRPNQPLDERAN